jgi:hypothetical protein
MVSRWNSHLVMKLGWEQLSCSFHIQSVLIVNDAITIPGFEPAYRLQRYLIIRDLTKIFRRTDPVSPDRTTSWEPPLYTGISAQVVLAA